MSMRSIVIRIVLPAVLVAAIAALMIPMLSAQDTPRWIAQDGSWPASKAKLQALGEKYKTSDEMFDALKQAAHGGVTLKWSQMSEPAYDWSGIYTRTKGALHFDPDLPPESGPVTARLTPAGDAIVKRKADQLAKTGGEYDPISDCGRQARRAGSANRSCTSTS